MIDPALSILKPAKRCKLAPPSPRPKEYHVQVFDNFLAGITDTEHATRTAQVLTWVTDTFPQLTSKIAWNQPMFTDHGTFIIGFSTSKKHLAVAPELAAIKHFSAQITKAGYDHSKQLVRIPWTREVDFALLRQIIEFNIADKATCPTFWRK